MKQKIPFQKDITFKTKIGELTAISLDNDLELKGENVVSGNFYISGKYKMIETSTREEEYSYKIPCEIAISDEYDTYDASIDIDDFYYEIVNDEILRVNIVVAINNLERKEEVDIEKEQVFEEAIESNDIENSLEDERINIIEEIPEIKENNTNILDIKTNEKETYLTYRVYMYKEEDTIESVLEKYNISKEELESYNDLNEIKAGTKLVIPNHNDQL